MKKLYYTIEIDTEIYNEDDVELTGNKTISVYDIIDNVPKLMTTLNVNYSEKSKNAIEDYLTVKGYDIYEIELILL